MKKYNVHLLILQMTLSCTRTELEFKMINWRGDVEEVGVEINVKLSTENRYEWEMITRQQ